MPSRFTVVEDPLSGARETVESVIDRGHAAATGAWECGVNGTTAALTWANETVDWPARVVFLFALLAAVSSILTRCVIGRQLVRGHYRRCGLLSSGDSSAEKKRL